MSFVAVCSVRYQTVTKTNSRRRCPFGIHPLERLLLHYESEVSMNTSADAATETSERLKTTIAELAGIQSLLLAGELDPHILADFRDAVNRVRNTAWAAYR